LVTPTEDHTHPAQFDRRKRLRPDDMRTLRFHIASSGSLLLLKEAPGLEMEEKAPAVDPVSGRSQHPPRTHVLTKEKRLIVDGPAAFVPGASHRLPRVHYGCAVFSLFQLWMSLSEF
jgi:hypothetical protein